MRYRLIVISPCHANDPYKPFGLAAVFWVV
jgi:hypothetical protein